MSREVEIRCDGGAWRLRTGDQSLAVQMVIQQLLVVGIQFVGKLYGTKLFLEC